MPEDSQTIAVLPKSHPDSIQYIPYIMIWLLSPSRNLIIERQINIMNNNLSIINIVYNNYIYLFGCEKRVNSSLMLPDLISDHQEIILKDSNN